ncbi:cystathionine gamma-synthase [uncultured Helicobacter sp.]|uniref:cystathionine gamma-synthase n=1 Tax=uncultured Helicobacter sp. TaxID=175537 RepID=UPI002618D6AC|nr:cystathionine gamma-synthase [uncultured Helicobacter sp.]
MKAIIYTLIFTFAALMLGACSSDKDVLSTNECPQNALCLYKNVSFTHNIMPNAYKASIRITESDTLRKGGEIESNTKKDIANTLNDILNLSKERGFCEGGNHDLRPNIQYKDGAARDTVGYTLNFNLECDVPSEKKKEYDTFIANIDKKINQNKYLSFLAPNVNVIATPQAWQDTQDKAFGGALELAKHKEKDYSKILNKHCILASADAMGNNTLQPEVMRMTKTSNVSAYADVNWELPMPKEQEITAKIQVKYICK